MFERFTDRARRVLVLAQEEARLLDYTYIGTEHILLGLIQEGDGVAARALRSFGISREAAREKIQEITDAKGASVHGSPPFTPRAKKVLELSLRESLQLGHSDIGTEHLLLGLIREGEGEGVASTVLVSLGVNLGELRRETITLMSGAEGAPMTVHQVEVGYPSAVPTREWFAPIWDRPSEGTVPVVLPVDALVLQNDGIVVAMQHLEVYPNGFTINLVMRVNPRKVQAVFEMLRPLGPHRWPNVSVRFADGRASSPIAELPKDEHGVPTEPIVTTMGAGGGPGGWRASAWVFPLPPAGPVEILVSLESVGLGESRVTLDGSDIRVAAQRATEIWS